MMMMIGVKCCVDTDESWGLCGQTRSWEYVLETGQDGMPSYHILYQTKHWVRSRPTDTKIEKIGFGSKPRTAFVEGPSFYHFLYTHAHIHTFTHIATYIHRRRRNTATTRREMMMMEHCNGGRLQSRNDNKLVWMMMMILGFVVGMVNGKIPDAEITINGFQVLAAYGDFGSKRTIAGQLQLPPHTDPWLCSIQDNSTVLDSNNNNNNNQDSVVLLVKRGRCSFEQKTWHAQRLGAVAVIVYNNLESRYGYNETSNRVIYPKNKMDYECGNHDEQKGILRVAVQDPQPQDAFVLDPPAYNTSRHDAFLTMDSPENQCVLPSRMACVSQRCLVAQKETVTTTTSSLVVEYTVCCAWDIHVGMSPDDVEHNNANDMVAVFVSMSQYDQVFSSLLSTSQEEEEAIRLTIAARPYPRFNASYFMLWLLGIAITAGASWLSANDYRRANHKLSNPIQATPPQPPQQQEQDNNDGTLQEEEEEEEVGVELPLRQPQEPEQAPPPMTISVPQHAETEDDVEQQQDEARARDPQQEEDEEPKETNPVEQARPSTTNDNDHDIEAVGDARGAPAPGPPQPEHEQPPPPPQQHQQQQQQEETQRQQQQPEQQQPQPQRQQQQQQPQQQQQRLQPRAGMPTVELGVRHAVAFVVFASTLLLLLFYFEFYTAITIIYIVGGSAGLSQLVFRPFFLLLIPWTPLFVRVFLRPLCRKTRCFEDVTLLDLCYSLAGYVVGGLWLYVWFTANDPSSNVFYWLTQDVMGACISILFLGLLRLNSIKVATVLLLAVFLYDVFFVFITPYLYGGESVMGTVATSGGPGSWSADDCEKYPSESECRKGQPLPMLLSIPKINDFRGGSSLLGLGDIVLPGLLMSFAARLDDAKRLVRNHTRLNVSALPRWGYLVWLTLAYALGLLFALVAVVWTERSQPALLYIVPACLGTLLAFGRGELGELWRGPKVIQWADRLVRFCDTNTFYASFDDEATAAVSDDDDNDDDDDDDGLPSVT